MRSSKGALRRAPGGDVAGERSVWASLLKLLPPSARPGPTGWKLKANKLRIVARLRSLKLHNEYA